MLFLCFYPLVVDGPLLVVAPPEWVPRAAAHLEDYPLANAPPGMGVSLSSVYSLSLVLAGGNIVVTDFHSSAYTTLRI